MRVFSWNFYLVVYLILICITVIYLQFSLLFPLSFSISLCFWPPFSISETSRPKPLSIIIETIFRRLDFFSGNLSRKCWSHSVHRAWPNRDAFCGGQCTRNLWQFLCVCTKQLIWICIGAYIDYVGRRRHCRRRCHFSFTNGLITNHWVYRFWTEWFMD